MAVTRKKTTVYLTPELLREVKARAASTGRHGYEILEDALRQYLSTPQRETSRQALRDLLGQLGRHTTLTDEEAQELAYAELKAVRRARRRS